MTRPLVVRFGALGDMVLLMVAIRRLHERFGERVDVLGSGPWTRPLLERQPEVGDIYLMGSRRRPFWLSPDQRRLVRELKRRGAGPTWLFDAQIDKMRRLLTLARWSSQDLVTLDRLADISGEHFCDRWRRFVELEPAAALVTRPLVPPTDATIQKAGASVPRLQVSLQARADLENWLGAHGLAGRPLILIQVGNKRTMRRGARGRSSNTKYWPEERWAAVLRALRAMHPRHLVLLLGVPREARCNEQILYLSGVDEGFNLASEMTVPRLMALSERASGMISVDTGPAHVAAAVNCPTLVMYTCPGTMRIYATRSQAVPLLHLIGGTDERPSLMGITQDQVIEGWGQMIRARLESDQNFWPPSVRA